MEVDNVLLVRWIFSGRVPGMYYRGYDGGSQFSMSNLRNSILACGPRLFMPMSHVTVNENRVCYEAYRSVYWHRGILWPSHYLLCVSYYDNSIPEV